MVHVVCIVGFIFISLLTAPTYADRFAALTAPITKTMGLECGPTFSLWSATDKASSISGSAMVAFVSVTATAQVDRCSIGILFEAPQATSTPAASITVRGAELHHLPPAVNFNLCGYGIAPD